MRFGEDYWLYLWKEAAALIRGVPGGREAPLGCYFAISAARYWSVCDHMLLFPSVPHWHPAIPLQLKPNLR